MMDQPATVSVSTAAQFPQRPEIVPITHIMGQRWIALFIDSLALGALTLLINSTFGVAQITSANAGITISTISSMPGLSWSVVAPWPWLFLTTFLYFFLQEAFFGATIGKAMVGLKVVNGRVLEKPLGWEQALVRNLVRPFDALGGYFMGWLLAICSEQRRRLGDHLGGTLVVQAASVPTPRLSRHQVWQRLGALLVLCICLVAGCLTFQYYGRPPLVITGLANTHQFMFAGYNQIQNLQLGQPTWNQNTVTYPINFNAIDHDTTAVCRGSITLRWGGFWQGWIDPYSDTSCSQTP